MVTNNYTLLGTQVVGGQPEVMLLCDGELVMNFTLRDDESMRDFGQRIERWCGGFLEDAGLKLESMGLVRIGTEGV